MVCQGGRPKHCGELRQLRAAPIGRTWPGMEQDSTLAFDLGTYAELTETVEIQIHPNMPIVSIEIRPDALTRADFAQFSKLTKGDEDEGRVLDGALVRTIASWNLARGGEALPITQETFVAMTQGLYIKILRAIFDKIQGNLMSESA